VGRVTCPTGESTRCWLDVDVLNFKETDLAPAKRVLGRGGEVAHGLMAHVRHPDGTFPGGRQASEAHAGSSSSVTGFRRGAFPAGRGRIPRLLVAGGPVAEFSPKLGEFWGVTDGPSQG